MTNFDVRGMRNRSMMTIVQGGDQEQLLRHFQAGSVDSHHLSNLMNYVWEEEKFTKTPNNAKYTAIMEASARRLTKCT